MHLASARNDNSMVKLGAELTFHFNDDWVEGLTPDGSPLRLKLSELTRFDMDFITREGDDKTHFFFFILVEGPQGRLIYKDREPEYVYNPIPGLTRKDIAELNLGALAHLANLTIIRTEFGKVEPWQAFRSEGETGPPKTPEQRSKDDTLLGVVVLGVIAFGVWLLWRRLR